MNRHASFSLASNPLIVLGSVADLEWSSLFLVAGLGGEVRRLVEVARAQGGNRKTRLRPRHQHQVSSPLKGETRQGSRAGHYVRPGK